MKAKDKTEEVLKSIHVLFSKAEPLEGSKKKVIIDKDRMMRYLKDLNNCMYAMMDEYEISKQSKEKALRAMQKQSDEIIFDARKSAEDIYAASIMYTDHALDELIEMIEETRSRMREIHEKLDGQMESSRQTISDNQIDLKNKLSGLIDTQKYLRLIENENKRLKREAEKKSDSIDWEENSKEKIVPKININEDYFKAVGLDPDQYSADSTDENSSEEEINIDPEALAKLDEEYFEWKESEENNIEDNGTSKGFFGFGRKRQ